MTATNREANETNEINDVNAGISTMLAENKMTPTPTFPNDQPTGIHRGRGKPKAADSTAHDIRDLQTVVGIQAVYSYQHDRRSSLACMVRNTLKSLCG